MTHDFHALPGFEGLTTIPTPDAVIFHPRHLTGRHPRGRMFEAVEKFTEVLGAEAFVRSLNDNERLASRSADDTLFFPDGHPLAGQHRYLWKTGPDAMLYGYLRSEAKT